MGTIDNTRLVIRSADTEKLTVLPNGNAGINLVNPELKLHVHNAVEDNQIFVSGNAPSIRWSNQSTWLATSQRAKLGLATLANKFTYGSAPGDFVVQALSGSLILGTNNDAGNGFERARIDPAGYFGISTQMPTAKLHVNCVAVGGQANPSNIRFENLQGGTGTLLVIDANGYVYRGASIAKVRVEENITAEIQHLKNEIEEMKILIGRLTKSSFENIDVRSEQPVLFQNSPNPSSNLTKIKYSLPNDLSNWQLIIQDQAGKTILNYKIGGGGIGEKIINKGTLAAGIYFYYLYDGNSKIETKKMILTN